MKKQIAKKLSVFVILIVFSLLIINSCIQFRTIENNEVSTALSTLYQIEEILINNEDSLQTLTESLQEEYMIRVQMVAYILENIDINTSEEYLELASLVNVDEIHVFNADGIIYEGSESKYYGYSFDSGEQMSFFLPLLEDTSLTLCQDITPNTAEEKPMMYVATWKSDGTEIIQIGLEPERILEEQTQNELSYIFANIPTNVGSTLFAIDSSTGQITGSSESSYLDINCSDIGLSLNQLDDTGEKFYSLINDVSSLCIFLDYNGTYLGITVSRSIIYKDVLESLLTLTFFLILSATIIYFALMKIISNSLLSSINTLTTEISKIAGGDLDTKIDIETSPEFRKLSSQINGMVSSILNTTSKMSHILDFVKTSMAVYEYKNDLNRVFVTRKLGELLNLEEVELNSLLEDKTLFEEKLNCIRRYTTDTPHVYLLDNGSYIKIETQSNELGEYGIVIDVTDITFEKKQLEQERDYDILTDLYNRRAFYRVMDDLFTKPEELQNYALLVLDMDNLKPINDNYGHDGGDIALKFCAQLFKEIPTENKILSRLGGDEFAVLIYGEEDITQLRKHITILRHRFDNGFVNIGHNILQIKISAGYVIESDSNTNYHVLMQQADKALYKVKREGKNGFLQYDS